VQSAFWNSHGSDQFLRNLTSESEKVIYNKVVDNFIFFPTYKVRLNWINREQVMTVFTALLYDHIARKISVAYIMLRFIVSISMIWL
jgi:hypothetical protein